MVCPLNIHSYVTSMESPTDAEQDRNAVLFILTSELIGPWSIIMSSAMRCYYVPWIRESLPCVYPEPY